MNASVTLDELYPLIPFNPNAVAQAVPWLIEGLWQKGKLNALFGFEKAGKSRFLRWAVLHLLLGRPLFDKFAVANPNKILWLAGEEMPDDIMAGLLRQAAFLGVAPRTLMLAERLVFVNAAGMRLDMDKYRRWLEELFTKHGIDLLIIDPLRRVHGANENDNTAMSVLLNDLRKWSNTLRISEVLTHHTGHVKDDADWSRIATWSRGATDLPAIVDTAMFMENKHTGQVRILRQGRYKPLKDLYLLDGNEENFVYKLKGD